MTFDKQILAWRVDQIKERAAEIFPILGDAPIESVWVGIFECTPDMMPIAGPVDGPEGFFVCAGFSGHGFCLGPLMGRLMAEWIADGRPSMDLGAFHHQRFYRAQQPARDSQAIQRPG